MAQYRGGYVASCYAHVLFSVSGDNLVSVCEGVRFITEIIEINRDILLFLSNPTVLRQDKVDVVRVIGDYVDAILVKFMLVVIENNRGNMLLQIFSIFLDLVKKHNREVSILVTSSASLTKQEEKGICDALLERYGKVVSVTNVVDPDILGGFIIRVGSDIIDVSLNSYLQSLRELSKIAMCCSTSENSKVK